ncbi:hypothetical protein HPB52_008239 [Rhipicephalus sanguineus]|uniref:SLC41A/MgtE integral membrane domain-containing protein n=1 Tax=Rhipicephalus sanguineus TaxID=34632 RepID=A0A9D4PMH8_RHISA|nr:hypothetical protein HPB52_008239 [Rhipicephalus sanguineus]
MGSVSPTGHAPSHSPKGLRHRMVPRLTGDKVAKESQPLDDLASSSSARRSDVESGGEGDWTADEEVMVVDKEPLLSRRLSKDGAKNDRAGTVVDDTPESLWSVAVQVFVPFLIAGFGTVGAGLVLDVIQHWKVFQKVSELFILVPALLGLKGNLEMTLASRLSTQANLGKMDTSTEQWRMATGNLALLQCQATVVGFLASLFAMVMGWIPEGVFNWRHALLLCASSLLTASVASLALGLVMIGVVIGSRKCHVNPDNVATPIAASLEVHQTWLVVVVLVAVALLLPLWGMLACANPHTQEVLYTGVGGCILDFAVSRFHGIAVFQPVINGVGGNLVAVQASRISTFLHQRATLGFLPASDPSVCLNPFSAFFGKSVHARTARVLLLMVVPGHLVFTYGIRLLKAGHTSVTPIFLMVYLTAAVLQVLLLLYVAHVMVHWMWSRAVDPDNSAIPYLTALGDLAGTALLALSFLLLDAIGDGDSDVGD